MLKNSGDDVLLPLHSGKAAGRALNGPVVRFAAAAGEIDFFGTGVKSRGHFSSGLLNGGTGFPADGVNAGGIAVMLRKVGDHGFENPVRNFSSCGIVQIDKTIHNDFLSCMTCLDGGNIC